MPAPLSHQNLIFGSRYLDMVTKYVRYVAPGTVESLWMSSDLAMITIARSLGTYLHMHTQYGAYRIEPRGDNTFRVYDVPTQP